MAQNNAELSTQIQQQGGKMTPLVIQDALDKWKGKYADKLASLAGDKAQADKVFTICMNTVARNPALLECDFGTLANCILQSFQLGLYPGPFQECAYVPMNNNKTGKKEANFWPQYQGIVKLLLNAGNRTVVARVVRENDFFEFREGQNSPLYAPAVVVGKQRGARLFCYAAICTRHSMWQVEIMSPEQIATTKSRSRGATRSDSPWNSKYEDDVDVMWQKTVLKRCAKWCTKSAELVDAIEADNKIDGDPEISVRSKVFDIPLSSGEEELECADPKELPEKSVS